MEKEKIINFLYQSISDIQSTIRSIDVKLGFLFALIFAPLVGMPEIIKIYTNIFINGTNGWLKFLTFIVAITWILSAFVLFKAVAAISDPRNHIKGNLPPGCFYGGGRFSLNWSDAIHNAKTTSKNSVSEELAQLPTNEDALLNELIFEKLKISYIRDIKLIRAHYCFQLTFTWLTLGSGIWIYSQIINTSKC